MHKVFCTISFSIWLGENRHPILTLRCSGWAHFKVEYIWQHSWHPMLTHTPLGPRTWSAVTIDVGCETASEWLWWRFALHSVQIYVGYVDNMMTFCCLRHSSGWPVDCTIYTMVTDQLKCIELMSDMCLLIRWWIFLSDAVALADQLMSILIDHLILP